MRKAVLIVAILFISPLPLVGAEGETIHLWSNQAPGPVLLWDNTGNLTSVNPDQPLDLHLPDGNWTLVRLIDGIPQANTLNFNADFNATSFLNQSIEAPLEITGSAHLNISGPIAQSTQLNATWSSSISIPNTLGHPDLDEAHLGVQHQITSEFSDDSNLFLQWITNNTHLDCCAYDRVDMVGDADVVAYVDNQTWGWTSQANLTGQGDGRSTRLIWVPMTGSLSDHTDLRITLPAPHEIRYSPQSEHISGLPDDFVINRGSIGVTGNVTIALGTNSAPVASFHAENRELPWLPFGQHTTFESDCTDTSIVEPENRFILREGNTTLIDSQSNNMTIDSMFLNLAPSTWLNLTLECTDPQGLMSNYSMDVYIDGIQPTGIIQMQYLHPDDALPVNVTIGNSSISIPSGAVLSGAVQAGDDSAPPVNIQWSSNKSSGWIQLGIGNHAWNDIFIQAEHTNGQHLSIEDRHQAKPLTVYSLQLELIDAAGNTMLQTWEVTVTDRNNPNPRPALTVDGNYYGQLNYPIEGASPIDVSLQESWDDIDAIEQLTWEVELNGNPLDIGNSWADVASFTLPDLPTGRHVLMVNATDSSDNTGTHQMMFIVEPPIGSFYEITDVLVIGAATPGDPGALDITLENGGQGASQFRLCYLSDCTGPLMGTEATVDGPGVMTHRLSISEWAAGDVTIRIEFSDNTSIEHQTELTIQSEMTPLMWILLALPALVGLMAFWHLKRQPENEDS